MPSLYEGFSISLVEAQVNGLKCFTSDSVDHTSNICGNVEFVSLMSKTEEWVSILLNSNINRDNKVLEKIPDIFDDKKCYEFVYDFYINNLK